MRRVPLVIGLALAAVGAICVHLAAREPGEQDVVDVETGGLDAQLARFRDRLSADPSDVAARLQEALGTPAGQIVWRDRVAESAESLREAARGDAVAAFLKERFAEDQQTGRWRLRPDQGPFGEELIRSAETFNADVAEMRPAILKIANAVGRENETDRLVRRFLNHEAAPVTLYAEQIRSRVRPGPEVIADRLGAVFAKNEQGEFVIRPSRRSEAEQFLAVGQRFGQAEKAILREARIFASEMSDSKELDRRLKESLAEPLFVSMIVVELFDDNEDTSISQQLERLFDQLEHVAIDTGDGLSVRPEERAEVTELLDRYERLKVACGRLREPVRGFARQLQAEGPLEEAWRRLLHSDFALLKLAAEIEFEPTDPSQAVRQLLGEIVSVGQDGVYHVHHESPEEVSEFVREMFRMYRSVQRRFRLLEDVIGKIADQPLRAALASQGGKFFLVQAVQAEWRAKSFEGAERWIDEHFESLPDGLRLRLEAEEEIVEMLQQVREVSRELVKDDF